MIRGTDHFGHREAAGIMVDLFWDRRDLGNEFRVEVEDRRGGTPLCPAPGNRARGDPGLSSPVLGVGRQAGGVNEDQAWRGPPCLRQGCPQDAVLARAADEFALTTVLLFLAVTVVRWLRDPGSVLYIADLNVALVVIGALSGAILTGLIFTPAGKRSGGHMNPAVTVALWSMGAFPGRRVVPYALAQLAGSAAGAGFARLVWGHAVSLRQVAVGAIRPAPTWQPAAVFVAETVAMTVLIVIVGFLMTRRGSARLVPYAIGLSVGLVIAFLGPRSGGSINPARQLGPAVLSGQTTDLWIYLIAPVLGALAGAGTYRLLIRRTENESNTGVTLPCMS
jgi:MIP family channel proteins